MKFFQILDKVEEQKKLVQKRKKVFEELDPLIIKCEKFSAILNCQCNLRENENSEKKDDILSAMLSPEHQKKRLLLGIKSKLLSENEVDYLKKIMQQLDRNNGTFGLIRGLMHQVAFEYSDEILNSTQLININTQTGTTSKYRKIRTLKKRNK